MSLYAFAYHIGKAIKPKRGRMIFFNACYIAITATFIALGISLRSYLFYVSVIAILCAQTSDTMQRKKETKK